ncbi:MAG TPA: OmpH family outer membrane protein [Candidatus Polarisedimenticolia bacterium]|jgi:Skp family chaperone for outer membrane proteins|nr:OmpH family outer membrane protein [Candidatus Polarisedimenticolia bacterium]
MSRFILPIALALALLSPTVAGAQAAENGKIGVFDPEVLWKQTEVGKKINQDLSAARDRLQAQIDKKQEEMEALKSRIRQQQQSLSEDKINEMKKDVLAKQTELERLNEDATKEMKYQLGETQSRFQEMIMKTLDAYGKEKGYALILNRGVVDYSANGIDISQDLIAKFNEMHKPTAVPPGPAKKPDAGKEPPKN